METVAQIPDMVWVDMETTGLDHTYDVPLEIGLMTTDRLGREISHATWLIGLPEWKDKIENAKQHEFVGPMHLKNGLWWEWDTAIEDRPQDITPRRVQDEAVEWLDNQGVRFGKHPVCGSSVRLDRDFMFSYLLDIDCHFHYRIIDVSSIKEACALLNPKVREKEVMFVGSEAKKTHRPIGDIRSSILEWRFYAENFMWTDWEAINAD
jgi:oligoribonuclease